MYESLTVASRRVLRHAHDEAQEFDHRYTGTEHLLLGLFHWTSPAKDALEAAGVTHEMVHEEVEKWIGRGAIGGGANPSPLNNAAKKALQQSIERAEQLGSADVEPSHLLLGILAAKDEEDRAKTILKALGLNLEQLRDGVTGRLISADNEAQVARRQIIAEISEHAYAIKKLTDRLQQME